MNHVNLWMNKGEYNLQEVYYHEQCKFRPTGVSISLETV